MKKVIHVDNSEFFRKQMASFLQAEGFEVESYDNSQEASFAIGAGSGEIVIMGLTFADSEGKEFVSKTVKSFSGPVFVVSSSVDKKLEDELMAMGVKAAVNKSGPWKEELKPHLSRLKGK